MADPPPRRPRRWVAPLVAVVVAGVLAAVLLAGGSDGGPPDDGGADGAAGGSGGSASTTTVAPDPVAIESDAPMYATLEELLAASDLVVRARVTGTERGRVFGDPEDQGGDAIESRLVAVEVTDVLSGAAPPDVFYIEEEGWLLDGAPLVVDGLSPSAEGDDAIWFLVDPTDAADEASPFVTVNAQGRYVVDGDALVGAEGDDPLVAELAALTPDQLEDRIRAAADG